MIVKTNVSKRPASVELWFFQTRGAVGPLKAKIWRLGLMGYCAQKANVLLLLAAMEKVLTEQGARVAPGAGVAAAIRNYAGSETAVAATK